MYLNRQKKVKIGRITGFSVFTLLDYLSNFLILDSFFPKYKVYYEGLPLYTK